ncbi:bifunctional DNA primase/polymerase [Myxococcota bacterium]|nr:bifunctional DNA primase/polymerase [Myxococcota bacterium]
MQRDAMYQAALSLLRRGFAVFPLAPRGKEPLDGSAGCRDATRTLGTVRRWWNATPAANVAIATGARWGCWVLDVDSYKGGAESLAELEAQHGPVPRTLTVRTGGGGLHLFFRASERVRSRNRGLPKGIDVRGHGGHVVGPGSIHASGRRYEIILDVPLVDAPAWLLDVVSPRPAAAVRGCSTEHGRSAFGTEVLELSRVRAESRQTAEDVRRMIVHAQRALARATDERNDLLNYWAFTLAGTGISEAELETELWCAVQPWLGLPPEDPFTRKEFEKTFYSGFRAGARRPLPKLARAGGGRST